MLRFMAENKFVFLIDIFGNTMLEKRCLIWRKKNI